MTSKHWKRCWRADKKNRLQRIWDKAVEPYLKEIYEDLKKELDKVIWGSSDGSVVELTGLESLIHDEK